MSTICSARTLSIASCCAAFAAGPALAQTDVAPDHKHSWGENIGFMNWRDAGEPDGAQGVRLHASFLSGFVWGENTGWITLGDGDPDDGSSYGNADGADCGVNLDPSTGNLSGYAWGENIGWINFSGGAMANPPRPARLDLDASRLRGYAWAENVGWVSLDDGEHYVAFLCTADFNDDGSVNTLDVLVFLNAWVARDPAADFNDDGSVNTLDVLAFLNAWSTGC